MLPAAAASRKRTHAPKVGAAARRVASPSLWKPPSRGKTRNARQSSTAKVGSASSFEPILVLVRATPYNTTGPALRLVGSSSGVPGPGRIGFLESSKPSHSEAGPSPARSPTLCTPSLYAAVGDVAVVTRLLTATASTMDGPAGKRVEHGSSTVLPISWPGGASRDTMRAWSGLASTSTRPAPRAGTTTAPSRRWAPLACWLTDDADRIHWPLYYPDRRLGHCTALLSGQRPTSQDPCLYLDFNNAGLCVRASGPTTFKHVGGH
jgi:hypothetical protein